MFPNPMSMCLFEYMLYAHTCWICFTCGQLVIGVTIHRCIDYRHTKMLWYTSWYKIVYRDTNDFWVPTKFYQNIKNTKIYPNQILLRKILAFHTWHLDHKSQWSFPRQKCLSAVLKNADDKIRFACGTSLLVRTTLRIPDILFQQTIL